jgi:16S rRNA processing protein RimM
VTDRVERLDVGSLLWCDGRDLVVTRSRTGANRRRVAGFEGIDTREAIEQLNNEPLFAAPLDDADALWVHELIGKSVVDQNGDAHGPCRAVVENPASDLLELESGALVPTDFVTSVDDQAIHVDVPDGLFDPELR